MASRYAREMDNLPDTFSWAASSDLGSVRRAVCAAGATSLRAVGSGGSLTAAHVLATLHRRYTGNLAAVSTPLEAISEPLNLAVSTWLLTAGGSNVDILSAAKVLIGREPSQLAVLCGRRASRIADLCRQHPFVDLMIYPPPSGKDGFLATNSLLAFATILARAYATEFNRDEDWNETQDLLKPVLRSDSPEVEAWRTAVEPAWSRPTTLILHGPSSQIGAIDLESKFTESALGNVQLADYRNFAHGRHHWLAKRGSTSSVLALITEADRRVAERTLDLIPPDIPQAKIRLQGRPTASALASLVAALWITHWAGLARGIDPGRPGVPEFGRRIYRLRIPHNRRVAPRLSARQSAAISRKSGLISARPEMPPALDYWSNALQVFLERLQNSRFGAVVLDYDGTIVDTRDRYAPPTPEVSAELIRLAESGVRVGIATGRGKSVRRDLQDCLPRALWPTFLLGYYNGAEVAPLDRDDAPDGSQRVRSSLQPLVDLLSRHPALSQIADQKNRPFQITLKTTRPASDHFLWEAVNEVVQQIGSERVTVVRSGHSVDVLAPGVSKMNVVQRLRDTLGDTPILTIGDQGRWPGNDCDLLKTPFALSVDKVSADPSTCWHLGQPGQRGPTVTLDYLAALDVRHGHLKFTADAFR